MRATLGRSIAFAGAYGVATVVMAMVCGLLLLLALTAPIGHGLRRLPVLVIPLLFLLYLVAG